VCFSDFGCKRLVLDPGYLESLHRPNVDMEWDPIARIVSDGIETKSGEVAFPVFTPTHYLFLLITRPQASV
jgi:hypothetical protein